MRSERGDVSMSVVMLVVSIAVIAFIILISVANRTDDIAQATVEAATTNFVDTAATTGEISPENYDNLIQTLTSTGNTYDVEIEVQVLDENQGKKAEQGQSTIIGENSYYLITNAQILPVISPDNGTPSSYKLMEGYIITCRVKNTNPTFATMLSNLGSVLVNDDTYTIAAEKTRTCTTNGK